MIGKLPDMNVISSFYHHRLPVWKKQFLQFIHKQKHWLFIVIAAYCLADLLILYTLPLFISDKPPTISKNYRTKKTPSASQYTAIWDFNIFHDGDIPPPLSSIPNQENITQYGEPQLSRLPLQLNGTIVYRNPDYSIANISVSNKKMSEVYQINDVIESMARITYIDSDRVYFINLNNSQEEYIQLIQKSNINFQFQNTAKKTTNYNNTQKESLVKKTGDFQFQVKRSDINRYMKNLPSILQDAKVVPHMENGRMSGFRFKYIKSGSVYEQLGFKVSDVLVSVNGEQLESELQAAELFHQLKNQSKLDMTVQREGKNIPFSWAVNEDSSIEEPIGIQ